MHAHGTAKQQAWCRHHDGRWTEGRDSWCHGDTHSVMFHERGGVEIYRDDVPVATGDLVDLTTEGLVVDGQAEGRRHLRIQNL